jgi:hypothetical protein
MEASDLNMCNQIQAKNKNTAAAGQWGQDDVGQKISHVCLNAATRNRIDAQSLMSAAWAG